MSKTLKTENKGNDSAVKEHEAVETKETHEDEKEELTDEKLQEIIKEHKLKNIGIMVCGEFQSLGDILSKKFTINDRINILISGCLERLSLVKTTMRFAQENEGVFEEYEIGGIETAVNEVYAMLEAALSLDCSRPVK